MTRFHSRLIADRMEEPVSLNIKDSEAHKLAQAISRATGESMTSVVKQALRERLVQIQQCKGGASVAELLAIAERAAAE